MHVKHTFEGDVCDLRVFEDATEAIIGIIRLRPQWNVTVAVLQVPRRLDGLVLLIQDLVWLCD